MRTKKILHLTLKKKWFDEIATGEKRWEYRVVKLYWARRLVNKTFDEIHFKNGYQKNAPFMRVEYLYRRKVIIDCERYYAIRLGKILQIKNWKLNTLNKKKKS